MLTAKRGAIGKVLIPEKNRKDLQDLPDEITDALKIVPVKNVEEVLFHALERFPISVMDPEEDETEGHKDNSENSIIGQDNLPEKGLPNYSH